MDGATRRRSCGLHYLYQRAAPTPSWTSLGHPVLLPAVSPRLLVAAATPCYHPCSAAQAVDAALLSTVEAAGRPGMFTEEDGTQAEGAMLRDASVS